MREAADRIANMNTHILALQKEIENLHMDIRILYAPCHSSYFSSFGCLHSAEIVLPP